MVFDVVRKSEIEIRNAIIDAMMAEFKAQHPKASPANLAQMRKATIHQYEASMVMGRANDPHPEKTDRTKASFQVLIDPATSDVVSERFPSQP